MTVFEQVDDALMSHEIFFMLFAVNKFHATLQYKLSRQITGTGKDRQIQHVNGSLVEELMHCTPGIQTDLLTIMFSKAP